MKRTDQISAARPRILIILIILSVSLPLPFAWGAPAAAVWATGPSHKVLRTEAPRLQSGIYDAAQRRVTLYAARNEFVAFQVVYNGSLRDVRPAPFALEGPGGTRLEYVQLFHEHYLSHAIVSRSGANADIRDCAYMERQRRAIGAPREYPVQMVPLEAPRLGAPFDVTAGSNEVVWVDIFVPESAPPGAYRGTLNTGVTNLDVALTVWNFTLPSVNHFPMWAYTGPEFIAWSFRKKHTEIAGMMPVFDAYFQMAHDHRIALAEGFMYSEQYVRSPDRMFFDHYSGAAFKGPFAAGFGFELLPAETACFGLIRDNGWLNRAFVYLADEPGSAEAYRDVFAKGRAVREATDGQLRRFVTEQYAPSNTNWPSLDPEVDIFCSGGTPPADIPAIERKGNVVWTYNGGYAGAPYTDAPGPAMRTHAWAGYLSGSRAWFFWHGVYTVDKFNRWRGREKELYANPGAGRQDVWNDALNFDESTKPWKGKLYPADWSLRLNGDGLLFYPGLDVGVAGPVACFRLKNLRQGAQDFEYLYLLEKAGQGDAARDEARRLVLRAADADGLTYATAPDAWETARYRLGCRLDALGEAALRARLQPYNQYPNPTGHPDWYGGRRF